MRTMNKKVTIKDVAEAAGVCKATVSYVLNDRKDQKISEETKKKVWQVVNMLGYRPNAFAQNMRTAVARQMFGVYLPSDLNALERALCLDFLEELIAVAREEDANIVLLPSVPERVNTADAIVTFFLTREQFFALCYILYFFSARAVFLGYCRVIWLPVLLRASLLLFWMILQRACRCSLLLSAESVALLSLHI